MINDYEQELINTPQCPAVPYGNYELFYQNIEKITSKYQQKGKVFVWLVVDTLGRAQCTKVVKTNNPLLNNIALEIVSEIKFSPARQNNRRVMMPMVLPVSFAGTDEQY